MDRWMGLCGPLCMNLRQGLNFKLKIVERNYYVKYSSYFKPAQLEKCQKSSCKWWI